MARDLPDSEFIIETGMYNVVCPICGDTHVMPVVSTQRTEWYRGTMPNVANAICNKPECQSHISEDDWRRG